MTTLPSLAIRQRLSRLALADDDDPACWREAAACRQADPEVFFPIGKTGPGLAEAQRAKAICACCPVRQPCLAFALVTNQQYGIWGGYDEDERRTAPDAAGA